MEVRRCEPADIPQVLQFLRAQFPESPDKSDEAYFRWRFEQCPLGSALPHYWLVFEDGELVGQMAGMPDRLWCDGRWTDCVWLVNLMLAPEHRGSLAALRLFQAVMQHCDVALTTGAGPHMERLYRSLRWRHLQIARTYYYPLRPGRLLEMATATQRRPGWARYAMPAMAIADLVYPAASRIAGVFENRPKHLDVDDRDDLSSEVEQVGQNSQDKLEVTTYRSADFYDWKFDRRPIGRHFGAVARDKSSTEPTGLIIAKWMQRPGVARWADVVDYLAAPADRETFAALVGAVCRRARLQGVDFVRCRLSLPAHRAMLRKPLWLERTAPVSDDVFLYCKDAGFADRLADATWHLTPLVSDRADYGRDDWRVPESSIRG